MQTQPRHYLPDSEVESSISRSPSLRRRRFRNLGQSLFALVLSLPFFYAAWLRLADRPAAGLPVPPLSATSRLLERWPGQAEILAAFPPPAHVDGPLYIWATADGPTGPGFFSLAFPPSQTIPMIRLSYTTTSPLHAPYPNFAIYPMLERFCQTIAPGWEEMEDTFRLLANTPGQSLVYNHLHMVATSSADLSVTSVSIFPREEYFTRHNLPQPLPYLSNP
jgi:hypothetical protein